MIYDNNEVIRNYKLFYYFIANVEYAYLNKICYYTIAFRDNEANSFKG